MRVVVGEAQMIALSKTRHARAWPGHPRLSLCMFKLVDPRTKCGDDEINLQWSYQSNLSKPPAFEDIAAVMVVIRIEIAMGDLLRMR